MNDEELLDVLEILDGARQRAAKVASVIRHPSRQEDEKLIRASSESSLLIGAAIERLRAGLGLP